VYLEAAGDEGLGAVVVKTRESAEIRTRNIDARSADLEIKDLSKKKKKTRYNVLLHKLLEKIDIMRLP
jgi:hypothetical protein